VSGWWTIKPCPFKRHPNQFFSYSTMIGQFLTV